MELPIPTHLRPFLRAAGRKNTEYEVTGAVQCCCGNEKFEVLESNKRQIVKLVCKQCGKEIVILDSGKHGWNGFVNREDFLDRTLPFKKHLCRKCSCDTFQVEIWISSQGKQDFLDECVANDASFSVDDWVNGFDWIKISLCCTDCSHKKKNWVNLETM